MAKDGVPQEDELDDAGTAQVTQDSIEDLVGAFNLSQLGCEDFNRDNSSRCFDLTEHGSTAGTEPMHCREMQLDMSECKFDCSTEWSEDSSDGVASERRHCRDGEIVLATAGSTDC